MSPTPGSHLLSWAQAAGFERRHAARRRPGATPPPTSGAWWSELWAERTSSTALADRAVELGEATRDELAELAAAWRRWAAHDDAWFAVPCGEILALTT